MKTTKGQTTSLVQRFAKALKVGDNSLDQAMDLQIRPRKNVTFTYRNRVQIGGEDSEHEFTVDTAQNTDQTLSKK